MLTGKSLFISLLVKSSRERLTGNVAKGAHVGLGKHMVTLNAPLIVDCLKVSPLCPLQLAAGSDWKTH